MDNEVARGNNTAIIHGHSRIKKYFYEAAESMQKNFFKSFW